eukprot:479063-Heterocapsa_arctica.AAC.1
MLHSGPSVFVRSSHWVLQIPVTQPTRNHPRKCRRNHFPLSQNFPLWAFTRAPMGLPSVPDRSGPMEPTDRWRTGVGGLPNPHSR